MRILLLNLPDHCEQLLLLLLRSVAEIQAKDVGSGKEESLDHFEGGGGRAERRELLRSLAPSLGDFRNGGD